MSSTVLDDETLTFLETEPGWVVLSTVGPDGFPHAVPLGYFHFEGNFYLGCRDKSQKVRNVERNPKVALLFTTPRQSKLHRGVLVPGQGEIIREPEPLERIRVVAARRRGVEYRPAPPGIVYICVRPLKVIQWVF